MVEDGWQHREREERHPVEDAAPVRELVEARLALDVIVTSISAPPSKRDLTLWVPTLMPQVWSGRCSRSVLGIVNLA